MTLGDTTATGSGLNVNTIPQFNPSQFGLLGTSNSGFFSGLGNIPIGGFGATGGATNGDFSSLFSSLNSSGTFGPSLNANFGPVGSNPQAIAMASEGANYATNALLNKVAPLDVPTEDLFSSSVYGGLSSGISLIDTLSSIAQGVAGTLPLSSSTARIVQSIGPAFGMLSGFVGIAQGLKVALNTPTVKTASSPKAMEDYATTIEGDE